MADRNSVLNASRLHDAETFNRRKPWPCGNAAVETDTVAVRAPVPESEIVINGLEDWTTAPPLLTAISVQPPEARVELACTV